MAMLLPFLVCVTTARGCGASLCWGLRYVGGGVVVLQCEVIQP